MKKIYIVLILTLIMFSVGFAQDKNCPKGHCLKGDVGYLNFAIGPSIPLGDFGSQDVDKKSSGFAESGYKIEVNGGYRLRPNFDLSAKCFYSIYSYDVTGLMNRLRDMNTGTKWKSNGRSWDMVGVMAGILYERPLMKKFTANTKILIGIVKSSTPDLVLNETDGAIYKDYGKSATSFAYMLSVGGIYPIGRLIDVVGNLEYTFTKPSFNNVSTKFDSNGNVVEKNSYSTDQNITLLAFNFGVRVKF